MLKKTASTKAPVATLFIRLAVGLIFFTQGILKYTDPHMGVLRFEHIGFPIPGFTAHFVGAFEIVGGFLVVFGLWTRLAAIPLLIIILTAIGTTKIPELFRPEQGFWFMVSDARADFAMLMGLIFLLIVGAGRVFSFDTFIGRSAREPVPDKTGEPDSASTAPGGKPEGNVPG